MDHFIASARNPKIQEIRGLQNQARIRRDANSFVVEGIRLSEEALTASIRPRQVFYTSDISDRGMAIVTQWVADGVDVYQVSLPAMKAASDTQTPQGILAVLPIQHPPLPSDPSIILVLDQIRDPGNLGTLFRTAVAVGVDTVLLSTGSVDPYTPKVIRAGMGAHFRLNFHTYTWTKIIQYLKQERTISPLSIFLADASGETPYYSANLTKPFALIIGGEAEGAGKEVEKLNYLSLSIPMAGRMESLNAGIAAGVVLFEAHRQRSKAN